MPSITSLPNELVVLILESLSSEQDAASLCLVSRKLYEAVSPVLYKNAVDRHDMWPLAFAAFSGNARTLSKMLAAGADPNWLFDEANMPREAWPLLTIDDAERVPKPPNTPFGVEQESHSPTRTGYPAHHAPAFGRHPWSLPGSVGEDDDFDVDEGADADDFGYDDELMDDIVLGAAGGFGTPLNANDDYVNPYMYSLDDDMSDEEDASDSDVGSTDSSTLGSGDRPQDGAGRNHDSPWTRFFTALHIAAAMGSLEVVQILLDQGASIGPGCRGLCACKYAAGMLNNLESPERQTGLPQWTPLHVAICYNRADTAKLLLSRGAACRMETQRSDQQYDSTALHHAAGLGQVDLVKYIVDNGYQTDIDVRDRRTLTPFYYAYANGRWDSTIPLLLQMGADINVEIKFFQPYCTITPLGEAVRLGNFDDALKLLDLGADHSCGFVATGAGHRKGLSPLHLGCMPSARPSDESPKLFDDAAEALKRVKIMNAFIAKGSDVHSTDCYGDTPLISAAQNRVLPAVKALVAAGADVKARNSLGRSVIMQAVLGPSNPLPASGDRICTSVPETVRMLTGILRELVSAGARVDDVDSNGNNMLHLLFETRAPMLPPGLSISHVIRLLLTYPGADGLLTGRNKEGHLAFEVAFKSGFNHAYDILLRPGIVQRALTAGDLQRMCEHAMHNADHLPLANMELLLDLDVDRKFLSHADLFKEAVTGGYWSVVVHIVRRGIPSLDPETCTRLLWHAIDAADWELAYQLVELGADVNAVQEDEDGDILTPLYQVLAQWDQENYSRIERLVRILVHKGANIHHNPSSSGYRILSEAIEGGRPELVQDLLGNQAPLRDDPRAAGGYYLHKTLRTMIPEGSESWSPSLCVSRWYPHVVYALIRSGGDVTELDEDGCYPLAVLLRGLCWLSSVTMAQNNCFSRYIEMIRDLVTPGVDITKPDRKGKSIVGYLEEFLQTKAGRLWASPKLELVEHPSGAKAIKFKRDLRLRRGPVDRPVTTIWDTRL